MRSRLTSLLVAAVAVLAAGAAIAPAAGAYSAEPPTDQVLYHDGPTGRYLLGGTWLRRKDPTDGGLRHRWWRSGSTAGWHQVSVPNAWNATSNSYDSYVGEPVWYRKDFVLPSGVSGGAWRVRFESVSYRATVWLNGHRLGAHAGAYLPFELPLRYLKPGGTNRLVVRVDNRLLPTDFPPSHYTSMDVPGGGWWNYGGILREVYLRRVDRVDLSPVVVRPVLPCPSCAATVQFSVGVHNVTSTAQTVQITGNYGDLPVSLPAVTVPAGRTRTVLGSVTVAQPHLWWPSDPYLYPVTLNATASSGGQPATPAAQYVLNSGIRSIKVFNGQLTLNGVAVHLRGVSLHEDVPGKGAALDDSDRDQLMASVKDVGATIVRAHYPLDPYLEELADRMGVLLWSEIPVYRLYNSSLTRAVRRRGVDWLRQNILDNGNHASVAVWSIGNELPDTNPANVRAYIRSAAHEAHTLDPSRPVGMALEGQPRYACTKGYEPLDVLGLNDYFGWYKSTPDVTKLSGYLDRMHACHPNQALFVTEFGAEANHSGDPAKKGTYEFQQNFAAYHLAVFALKPWLSGALYWTLREFRCRPGWNGGNPTPQPPMHQKGLISYTGVPKPAYFTVQSIYHQLDQVPGEPNDPVTAPPPSG